MQPGLSLSHVVFRSFCGPVLKTQYVSLLQGIVSQAEPGTYSQVAHFLSPQQSCSQPSGLGKSSPMVPFMRTCL